ncbi:hypothetical protein M3Y98_00890600 [Aphelenchoides besseyi]|nr:hypothetical protein M3Y98_00890600 [Aphelenchoides besseyi]KAI6192987.1 hypothetical protein M3Y96_00970400 [Aphelenchoides besseyi]
MAQGWLDSLFETEGHKLSSNTFRENLWRLHLNGIGNDFELRLNGKLITVSKSVLVAESEYFAKTLTENQTKFVANDVDLLAVEKTIEFMYRGQLDHYTERIGDVAYQLGCRELYYLCLKLSRE